MSEMKSDWPVAMWVKFAKHHDKDTINRISAYISNTPRDQITKEAIAELGGDDITDLVIDGKRII